jgi:hypothetical protein
VLLGSAIKPIHLLVFGGLVILSRVFERVERRKFMKSTHRSSSTFRIKRTAHRGSTENLLGMHTQISHSIPVRQVELFEAAANLRHCAHGRMSGGRLFEARKAMKHHMVRFLAHLTAFDPELVEVARPIAKELPAWSKLGFLPAGIYEVRFEDFAWRFSFTPHRRRLLTALYSALMEMRRAGIKEATIGGSFVSTKKNPKDVDLYWPIGFEGPNPLDNKQHSCYRRWIRRLDAMPDIYGFKSNLLGNRTLGILPKDVPEQVAFELAGQIPTRIAVGVVRLNLELLPDRLVWLEEV